jgi:hypothetical protein
MVWVLANVNTEVFCQSCNIHKMPPILEFFLLFHIYERSTFSEIIYLCIQKKYGVELLSFYLGTGFVSGMGK